MRKAGSAQTGQAKGGTARNLVDEYLAGVPEPARGALKKLRAVIRSAVPPGTTETISLPDPDVQVQGAAGGLRRLCGALQPVRHGWDGA